MSGDAPGTLGFPTGRHQATATPLLGPPGEKARTVRLVMVLLHSFRMLAHLHGIFGMFAQACALTNAKQKPAIIGG